MFYDRTSQYGTGGAFYMANVIRTSGEVYQRNSNILVVGIGGDFYLPAVYNHTSGSAANVFIDTNGRLYRSSSSLKYKKDVINYDKGLDTVKSLRPIYYKDKNEENNQKQYAGFIAEL